MTIQTTFERLQTKLADRYQVERELGKGGMATVYLAKDIRHDREVAIKVLHPELSASIGAERFEREIKLSAKLQHPHILGLIDSGEADGLLYYVMPFVRGESLRDRLDREGQLPIEDAIQVTLEVADALGHAHAAGIIHRDIKPENILLSGGHALVADFGIARAATEAGAQKLTQTGMAVGTPVYMAPEQSVGDAIGPTADLYSLGCMLYEMLAGEPPFTAKNAQALMARHAMEAVPSIRIVRNTVPEEVEDTIFAAMAKVPADRPQNAAQFAELLGMPLGATASRRANIRHTASRRVPTAATRVYQPEAPPWWRRPWVIAAGVLVLAGGSFAGYKLLAKPSGAGRSVQELAKLQQVAVLYFENPDQNAELDPVADGLTEGLIRSLKDAGLSVRGAAAVAPFRGKGIPEDSIARALEVGTVIKGSVAREGQSGIKVTTLVIDGASGTEVSRVSATIPRDSLFKAEDAVAAKVAEGLREQLGKTVDLKESRARAGNLAAWTLYQRAEKVRKDAEQTARTDRKQAALLLAGADSLLEKAVNADPTWIDPIILRGQVALLRFRVDPDTARRAGWMTAGKGYAEQALQLDKRDANAMALRGTLRWYEWLALPSGALGRKDVLDSAQEDLERAVLADRTLASAYATLSFINYQKNDVSGALKNSRAAHDADAYLRNADLVLNRLFWSNYDLQQFPDAAKACSEGARRFPADHRFVSCQLWLMVTPEARPDINQAWQLAKLVDSLRPKTAELESHIADLLVGGAIGKVARGSGLTATGPLADSARRVLARAVQIDPAVDQTQELMGYEGIMLAQMGDLDQAMARLKRYVALNPDHTFEVEGQVHWWYRDLRNRPDFNSLMARR